MTSREHDQGVQRGRDDWPASERENEQGQAATQADCDNEARQRQKAAKSRPDTRSERFLVAVLDPQDESEGDVQREAKDKPRTVGPASSTAVWPDTLATAAHGTWRTPQQTGRFRLQRWPRP